MYIITAHELNFSQFELFSNVIFTFHANSLLCFDPHVGCWWWLELWIIWLSTQHLGEVDIRGWSSISWSNFGLLQTDKVSQCDQLAYSFPPPSLDHMILEEPLNQFKGNKTCKKQTWTESWCLLPSGNLNTGDQTHLAPCHHEWGQFPPPCQQ